jgi:MFS family permease
LSYRATRRPAWFYSSFVGSIVTGPLSVFLAIYVLKQGYSVIYYSIIVSQGSLATIIGSIVWGVLMDRGYRRGLFLAVSYGGVLLSVVTMYLSSNIFLVGSAYAALNFFGSAAAPAANLLVMQSWKRAEWSDAYGYYLFLGSMGGVAGLVLGSAWTVFLPLHSLLVPLIMCGGVATVFASTALRVELVPLERRAMLLDKSSFLHRFILNPSFYIHPPRAEDFTRFTKMLRNAFTRPTPILYLSLLVFNLGSGIFNTAFNPSLYLRRSSESLVFAVNIFAMLIQGFTMRRSGQLIPEGSETRVAQRGLAYRAAGYLATALSVNYLSSAPLAVAAALSFSLAGGYAYSLVYVSLTVLVFRSLPPTRQGSLLGTVSALSGIGAFTGSLLSGALAQRLGYPWTDTVAALLMLTTLLIIRAALNRVD